jgi:hypothetical protein
MANEPSVATSVIRAELGRKLHKLGVRELVRRYLVRAHNLAQHVDLAETDLTDHVNEFAKLDLSVAARIDLFDQTGDLLGRQILSELLERSGDFGRINAENA